MLLTIAGSMPIGMFGLAILLLARDATGSYAEAGHVVGAFSIANALGAVAQGRLMDRLGQAPVLRAAAAVHLPALIALVAVADAGAGSLPMALIALFGGASLPQVPAAMRSLWTTLAKTTEQRETAYAVVGITFEIAVVAAPALVGVIATLSSPTVATVAAAGLGTTAALAFTFTPASRRWRGTKHEVGWLGPLAASGMRTVFAVMATFGTALGAVQIAVPAFADEHGSAASGGVLLAGLSIGSMAGGFVYGARSWPGRPSRRLVAVLLGAAAMFALLVLPGTRLALAATLVLVGLLAGPVGVICSTLLDDVAPRGTMTEAFAAMVMGVVTGIALGQAVGGSVIEARSYEATVLLSAVVAAAGAALALVRGRTLAAPPEPA
jgi:MFS family permease